MPALLLRSDVHCKFICRHISHTVLSRFLLLLWRITYTRKQYSNDDDEVDTDDDKVTGNNGDEVRTDFLSTLPA